MKYVEAPNIVEDKTGITSVFLGGGITSCKDWQVNLVEILKDYNVTIYNPRRNQFDLTDVKVSEEQIRWEHKYLHESNILVFYFAEETLCPITLFELGAALERNMYLPYHTRQHIIIYCEPGYKRKFDVEFQSSLAIEYFDKLSKNPDILFVQVTDNYDVFIDTLKLTITYLSL